MQTIEQFEAEIAKKRERLLKDIDLVKALPTQGQAVTWIGEGGFEQGGNTRKPDITRTVDLLPYIVHSPFRGHEHVAFQVPNDKTGEYQYSKHRKEFASKYLLALLDACEPYIIDTVAVRGTYASLMPSDYDYKANRDYKDAVEVSRGKFEVQISTGTGYTSASLVFYIHTQDAGTVQVSVSVDKDFATYKLLPRAHYSGDHHNAVIASWSFPNLSDVGAVNVFKRSNVDRNSYGQPSGYTLEWLFDSREKMLVAIGL